MPNNMDDNTIYIDDGRRKITYTINNLYNKGTYKSKISYKSKYYYKNNGKNIKFKIKA